MHRHRGRFQEEFVPEDEADRVPDLSEQRRQSLLITHRNHTLKGAITVQGKQKVVQKGKFIISIFHSSAVNST